MTRPMRYASDGPNEASHAEVNEAPPYSDEDVALGFADLHKDNLRFVAAWNKWMLWRETHWQMDSTLPKPLFAQRWLKATVACARSPPSLASALGPCSALRLS